MCSDGDPRNSGVTMVALRCGMEEMVDHHGWLQGFVWDLVVATGENRKGSTDVSK